MWKAKRKKKYKNRKVYIHYGADFLDKERPMKEFDFSRKVKPKGIWASPKYSNWGWKNFCESEYFEIDKLKASFEFKIKRKSRVLEIRTFDDIKPYLKEIENKYLWGIDWYDDYKYELDLEKIYNEFDAMEIHMHNNYRYFHNHSHIFTMWDVDSIVIWNCDIIEPIKKKTD